MVGSDNDEMFCEETIGCPPRQNVRGGINIPTDTCLESFSAKT
jgi:hypothetical protein